MEKIREITATVFKALTLAMGVCVVVLSRLGNHTDCGFFPAVISSSAHWMLLNGLYARRIDGRSGRLAGTENRDSQRVWSKTGQHCRSAVLCHPAGAAFSGFMAAAVNVNLVCSDSHRIGTASELYSGCGEISPFCRSAHLAE